MGSIIYTLVSMVLVFVFNNNKFSLFKCRGGSKEDIANDECGLPNKRERESVASHLHV
jgi:hypothetical protein